MSTTEVQKQITPPPAPKARPMLWGFAAGGTSGVIACCFVHPFDVIRIQMQVDTTATSFLSAVKNIARGEKGLAGFYSGHPLYTLL